MATELVSDAVAQAASLLRDRFPAGAIVTESAEVVAAARVWNAQVQSQPAMLVRCRTTAEVQAAVQAARGASLPLSVRGGGHDWAGRAVRDGALVIDLSGMRKIEVAGDVARVGGAATGDDLLDAAGRHGFSAAVGTVGSVGVIGLTLGGGYGSLIGLLGLAVDNLLSAEVVLTDGRVVTTDPRHEPDLFWALRGGGGNFGVVTRIETRLHPIPEVNAGMVAFGWAQAPSVLSGLRGLHGELDDALDVMFGAIRTPDGPVLFTTPVWAGSAEAGSAQISRVRSLGDAVIDDVARRPLVDVVRAAGEPFPDGGNYWLGSRIVPALNHAFVDAFVRCVDAMPRTCALNVHHAHGAATRVPIESTSHAYRDEHLVVEILGRWTDGDGSAERAWVHNTERAFDVVALPGGWTNLMAPGDPRARDAYGVNTARLLAVKAQYDPDGILKAIPLPS
jgi:FAD/FMN-containing dehydrogenase